MSQSPQKTALIIGATGSFGGHVLVALLRRGWRVRALARDPQAAARKAGLRMPIDWAAGDAMNAADVAAAAQGVDLIVHGANPPGYRNWRGLALPMLDNTIAAAIAEKARILFPGNVYNYAPDAGAHISEATAQAPITRKGKVRVEMEEGLKAASQRGARVLIVRAGDFFGPAAPNSGLNWLTTRRGGKLRGVYQPGPASVGHAWAYLPDLAEAVARLADREDELGDFASFNFAGHWLERSDEMAASISRVVGQPKLPVRAFPYPAIYALSPFVEMFRELIEMRYLWRQPIGMDNAKLVAFLGEEPHTPLDRAMAASLADLGINNAQAPADFAAGALAAC